GFEYDERDGFPAGVGELVHGGVGGGVSGEDGTLLGFVPFEEGFIRRGAGWEGFGEVGTFGGGDDAAVGGCEALEGEEGDSCAGEIGLGPGTWI
ncbi:MAG: hypothetical protein Q9224_001917, partial [Gallowayella concinna]